MLIKYDHMVRWVNISSHGNVGLQEVNKNNHVDALANHSDHGNVGLQKVNKR